MSIHLQKITKNNVQDLQEVSIQTFTETFKDNNSEKSLNDYLNTAYELTKLEKELENPHSEFYFAYFNNELAGYLKININDAQSEKMGENALEVERIYIKKSFKRRGIGRHLIETAEQLAKKYQKNLMWLGVWEYNPKAIAFYETLGFKVIGAHSFFMGEEEQTDLIMSKQL
ncbi:MAG: GNAT family N-acetyltransferase [Turicibacter sp.]|jgi:ribosomal protein S18 acetylase RimI-like enzyme|uniref:Spermidine/spermine N(1)-acetyltransferase n=1 Tax=Turicibacter faecis TaxID=2963365 RepID=A0ABN6ZLP6_9FIRM|nr:MULTISPECIES: GNAT family N-acetyltransferase [unclassified Turicibacter]MCI8701204.1 GNAT family N-acetyltransferase [Turicibacter sp.]BEH91848.1 spermidine/spermine N(1)-acetyltransferase [Turicibacter sp. TC023]MCU7204970.1 GNAT family N-acetyltransferase [Turicibacter sp. TA25]MCU7209908.1 GNAT family N-acetyltransferase [Turicibacter sp. 1E2]NCE78780.1 GNAT family N-acetyltransferase [Turicibacter sp. TS3]